MVAGTRQLPGVLAVTPEALDHRLVVRYDSRLTNEAALTAAIDRVVASVAQ